MNGSEERKEITLTEHAVFQQRGVSWMSEVDVVQCRDKQYTRRTYLTNMNMDKEREFHADVLNSQSSTKESLERRTSIPQSKLEFSMHKALGRSITDVLHCQSSTLESLDRSSSNPRSTPKTSHGTIMDGSGIAESEVASAVGLERKAPPPQKPPRKTHSTLQNSLSLRCNESEVVTIEARRNHTSGEPIRVILCSLDSPLDSPSIMEAGSRVSSFAPRTSSFSRPPGHMRSRSDTVKIDQLSGSTDVDTPDSSLATVLRGAMVTGTGALSSQSSTPQSSMPTTPKSPLSPHPSTPKSPHTPLSLYPVPPKSKSPTRDGQRTKSPNLPPKSPLLLMPKPCYNAGDEGFFQDNIKLRKMGDVSTGRSADKRDTRSRGYDSRLKLDEENQVDVSVDPGVKLQQNVLLKELNSRMYSFGSSSQNHRGNSETMDSGSNPTGVKKHDYLDPRAVDCVLKLKGTPNNVRKSSFVTHDEVGFLLEDKPLSSEIQQLASKNTVTSKNTVSRPSDLASPLTPYGGISGYEDPTTKDCYTPTWPPNTTSSNLKSADDTDKPQAEDHDDPDNRWDSLTRPSESVRISQIAEHLPELTENIKRDGFLHRTFLVREGKKVRKNWTQSYARFIVREFDTGSTGLIYFSKSRDEDKKAEVFEFYPPCQLEQASDKKTSRQLVLGLRNSHETEILLQFDDRDIANEWHKALENHEGVSFVIPEKKGKRGGSDKLKRESSMEQLNPDSLGITDKLRNFIKRRPLKETLEKKGIYKESVFGSTLSELHIQDKTTIPIFVLQCINHIEKSEENLRSDGLYRISGNAAQIQKIRFEVAQRNYTILSQEKEIHNLSGSLKLFFRELKEPLVPYAVYDDFIQATGSARAP